MKFDSFTAQALPFLGIFVCSLAAPSFSSSAPAKQWDLPHIPPSTNLVWYPCFDRYFCAMLDVPLDYKNPKGYRASVPLIKYPASSKPYKGMVLTNPGGPGISGVRQLLDTAEKASKWVGANYDYVSWDPRGIGYSLPAANCTASESPLSARGLISRIKGPEIPISLSPVSLEQSIRAGILCKETIGADNQAGPHMTTTVVVKDIISILDAFARTKEGQSVRDASLLNYWGTSYGTVIGQTFASIFPKRVGRMVVDAVINADNYSVGSWASSAIDSDRSFSSFFLYCHHAGPYKCSFYTGQTPAHVYQRFQSILAKLDPKLAGPNNQTYADVLTFGLEQLRTFSFGATYVPDLTFPWLADILVELETLIANGLTYNSLINWVIASFDKSPIQSSGDANTVNWNPAIECSDADQPFLGSNSTAAIIAKVEPLLKALYKQSYMGYSIIGTHYIACAGWQIRSNDAFKGPFGGKTKHPILFVSNTLDPITPIVNARNGAKLFEKAEILTVEAVGHSVTNGGNKCGFKKINEYFQTGKLPGHDNFCPSEPGPWGVTLQNLKRRTFELAKSR